MIGTPELIIISGVAVLLFGASAIPKLAKSIGRARSEFEIGMNEAKEISAEAETAQRPV